MDRREWEMGKKVGEVNRKGEYENAEGTNWKEGKIWEETKKEKKLDRTW